jgi:hypothetical protein
LPESTMSYAAFSNYGNVTEQALKIFRQELQESAVLHDWWQHGNQELLLDLRRDCSLQTRRSVGLAAQCGAMQGVVAAAVAVTAGTLERIHFFKGDVLEAVPAINTWASADPLAQALFQRSNSLGPVSLSGGSRLYRLPP